MGTGNGATGMSPAYRAKETVATIALRALGAAFEIVSLHSREMQDEIGPWEEGREIALGVMPAGPSMTVRKTAGRIRFAGLGHREPTIGIFFKNLDSALMVLTGRLGSAEAFAQHRMVVHGALSHAMQADRAMAIVQAHLLPGPLLKNALKRVPRLPPRGLALKAWVLAAVGPAMVASAGRRAD